MARVANLQRGRQSKAVQVLGLKELQTRVDQLKTRAVSDESARVAINAGALLYQQAQSNLRSVNAPHEVAQDLFIYGKQPGILLRATSSVTALVGLRKRGRKIKAHGYVEWFANKQVSSGREKTSRSRVRRARLVMRGTKIGENLGTMWELGTSKMAARPWWRPAVLSTKTAMFQAMAAGYRRILGEGA